MINFWIGLPAELRLTIVAAVGLLGGSLANFVIYRFAYFNPRAISPWCQPDENAPARRWTDRIPVVGWWGLRRESEIHGAGFWVRPLLVEIGTAVLLLILYRFETQTGGLLPEAARFPKAIALFEPYATQIFFSHAILVILMVAATFIDFDERTIPDIITIPGTLVALAIASLTTLVFMPTAPPAAAPLTPTTFQAPWFVGDPKWWSSTGLWTALGIWTGWCFALADRRWSWVLVRRRGLPRAIRHFINGLFHYGFWKLLLAMWLLGGVAVFAVWQWGGNTAWEGLLTSLCGLAVGGGVIWAIRIVATWALNMEAMGFGDVTLMAMIGAFIGWHAAIIAFFLSPFAAIVIVLVRYIITRDAYTPFGPYLCAGTLLSIFFWDHFYTGWLAGNLLMMGAFLLWLCLSMLGLMAGMLFVWRHIKMRLF